MVGVISTAQSEIGNYRQENIMDGWIPHHGAPEQLHSDRGSNLNGKLIKEICSWLEIWKTRTTPFHPQSDGVAERSIRTVNAMLAKQFRTIKRIGTYTCHLPVWHITQQCTRVQSTLLST